MKFNGKHIAIAAGLGAVLALSPVAGTVGTAFANDGEAVQAAQAQSYFVGFSITDPETGTQVDMSNYMTDGDGTEKVDTSKVPTVPEHEGWEFAGWQLDGEIYSTEELGSCVVWEDTVFETAWTYVGADEPAEPEAKTFTFRLVDNEGNVIDEDATCTEGSPLSEMSGAWDESTWGSDLMSPSKEGYRFLGWKMYGDNFIDLDETYAVADGITLTAYFEKVDEPVEPEQRYIAVNYWDGDTLLGTGAVLNGTADWSGIVDPAKDGYTFLGWSFEGEETVYADLSGVRVAYDDTITEIDVYANWEEDEAPVPEDRYITVNYWDGDTLLGTGAVLNKTNQWSGIVDPAKDGYTFLGWRFEGDSEVTPDLDQVVFGADETVTEINLYAEWEKAADPVAETHKVTFDDRLSDTENLVVEVEDGGVVSEPPAPTCTGWKFEGWYSDTGLTQEYDFSAPVTSDMTLWAKWSKVADEGAGDDGEQGGGAADPTDSADAGEASPDKAAAEQASSSDGASDAALPETGDLAGAAAAIVGVAGAAAAGAGAILGKRRK